MVFLIIWLGLMGLAGAGAAGLILSRFPEVFFEARSWNATRKGRVVRTVLVAVIVFFGLVFLTGVGMLVFELVVRAN